MLLQFGTLDNMVCHFQGFFKEFLLYISVRIGVFVRPWNRHLTHFDTAWILSGYLTCFWKHFHNCKILEIQSNLKIVNYQSCKIVHYCQVVSLLSNNTVFIKQIGKLVSGKLFIVSRLLFTIYPFSITKFDLSFDFETKWRKHI